MKAWLRALGIAVALCGLGVPLAFVSAPPAVSLTAAQDALLLNGVAPYTDAQLRADATWYFDAPSNTCLVNHVPVAPTTCIATARASGAYAWTAGRFPVFTLASAAVTRVGTAGYSNEGLRTTIITQPRNLANAAWTKGASMVATQTGAVGIDGVSGAATRITTSAPNQTVTIPTVSSSPRMGSVRIMCNGTCVGTVGLSIDTVGLGYTTLVQSRCFDGNFQPIAINPTGFVFCIIPTANLTNKINGLLFSDAGADYIVDFFQNENSGTFATSPIPVASVTRQADNSTIADVSMMSLVQGTWYAKYGPVWCTGAFFCEVVQMKVDASNKNGIEISGNSTTPAVQGAPQSYVFATSFTTQLSSRVPITPSGVYKTAFAYQNLGCAAAAYTPALAQSLLTQCGGASIAGTFAVTPGSNAGGQNLFGNILQLAYVPNRAPDKNLLGYARYNFLLQRDINPAANDNTPAFIHRVAANDNVVALDRAA